MNFEGSSRSASRNLELFDVTMTLSSRHDGLTMASPADATLENGCLVLEEEFNPQDNPDSIISKETLRWLSAFLSTGLTTLLFLVGFPGNILSAAVFYRQGLRERVNFCVFCLAVSDLVVITTNFLILAEDTYRTFIGPSNVIIRYFMNLAGFSWVSMFLSTVIATERCFCVVSPLRAQRMLSTRSLVVIVTPISLILLAGRLVVTGNEYTEICVFDPRTNETSSLLHKSEYYMRNKEILDIIDIFIYAIALPAIFFVITFVTTIITAVKLQSAVKWRQQTSSATTGSSENMVAVTRMLIGTSVLFVVCLSPFLLWQVTIFVVPELNFGGPYHNLATCLWGIVLLVMCGNSSLNFFIYYRMGSRFRQILKQLLSCVKDKQ